jgi:hypothetical protein
MSKRNLTLLSTPRDPVEEKNVIETVAKLRPDIPVERIEVCYEVDGQCVCDVVNSKDRLAAKLVARWFKQDKMRVVKGRGGPPVDKELFEMVKKRFMLVETRKP